MKVQQVKLAGPFQHFIEHHHEVGDGIDNI
jgi:hypothetical protein